MRHPRDFPDLPLYRPARVVILNDSSVARGGATGLALLSARLLHQAGCEVHFISGDTGDDDALAAQGITLHALGGALLLDRPKLAAATEGLYNRRLRDRITEIIAKLDGPDTVYHLHGWSRILTPAVFDALKPMAQRVFVHAHDYHLTCPNGGNFNFQTDQICQQTPLSMGCLGTRCDKRSSLHKGWRVLRQAALFNRFCQSAPWAGIVMIHPQMAPVLRRAGYPEDRLIVVRNPVTPFVAERVEAESNTSFAYVGRIEHGKGVESLCDAATRAGVPLTVIGEGALRADLQTRFANVTFTGWLSHAEIGARLRSVRALVMPSRQPEPFGLVTAEASRAGIPVLVSNRALVSHDVAAGNLGDVFDADDPRDLVRSLTDLAALGADRVRVISVAAHAGDAKLSLSPQTWIEALLTLYAGALHPDVDPVEISTDELDGHILSAQ